MLVRYHEVLADADAKSVVAVERQIAQESLDWNKLGPAVASYHHLIDPVVKRDTRKLDSYEAFVAATKPGAKGDRMSIEKFANQRRQFLLELQTSLPHTFEKPVL